MNKTFPRAISVDQKTNSTAENAQKQGWQLDFTRAIRSFNELLDRLNLNHIIHKNRENRGEIALATKDFPVLVPESFLNRMKPGDPNDPLLRQVLPDLQETQHISGFLQDPVGDEQAEVSAGLLQKYQGRALLITSGHCAINCRYCFRRNYPYENSPNSLQQWQPSLKKLAENSEIEEIILSGGDPLVLNDNRLAQLVDQLSQIDHLQRIRIHSRLPIVLPSRVTDGLLELFRSTRLQPIFVIHSNHPNELVNDCAAAVQKIVHAGIPVLNQAVLLNGINDQVSVQLELCKRLINLGAIPYYLHQLDRVNGAAHFETEIEVGKKIIQELKQKLPGYAVPKYVQEIPQEPGKTELS